MARYTDRRKQEIATRNKTWLLNPDLQKKIPVPSAEKKPIIRIPVYCPADRAIVYVRLENMHKYASLFESKATMKAHINKHLAWLEGKRDGILGTYSREKYKKLFCK